MTPVIPRGRPPSSPPARPCEISPQQWGSKLAAAAILAVQFAPEVHVMRKFRSALLVAALLFTISPSLEAQYFGRNKVQWESFDFNGLKVKFDYLNENLKNVSLKIENLEIAFKTPKGTFTAVKDINLDIEKGQIISIIGHSGCGKSTIMNAIANAAYRPASIKRNSMKEPSPRATLIKMY